MTLALTVFQGRAGDHNDRAYSGAAAVGATWQQRLGLAAATIGTPEPALSTDWRTELTAAKPLPSTQLAWSAWEGLMANKHWLEGIVANTCAERINVPGYGKGEFRRRGWFGMERGRWGRLFGLGEDELEFFELHTEADIEHSNTGWRAVEKFAKKLHMQDAAVVACERNLHVWEHYLNGIAAAGDAHRRKK